jgi:hypothetical protein
MSRIVTSTNSSSPHLRHRAARPAHVDDGFGDVPRHATGNAGARRRGEVDAEDLEKVACERVAVERDHLTTNPISST